MKAKKTVNYVVNGLFMILGCILVSVGLFTFLFNVPFLYWDINI